MDITVYDKLYEAFEKALQRFSDKSGITVAIAHYAPSKPSYPLVVFSEVRNQPRTTFYSNRQRISSLGYKADIFAKTKGAKTKMDIAREIMQFTVDFFQTSIGLNLISNNNFENVGTNGEIYQITLVFQQPYYENGEYFF